MHGVPYEVREEFFDLVCSGMPLQVAAVASGVSVRAGDLVGASLGIRESTNSGRQEWWSSRLGTAPVARPGWVGRAAATTKAAEDRSVIAAGLRMQLSYAKIGELIGRDKSVVCREVARNRGPDGSYWGPVAHRAAHERRRRPKVFKLVENRALCQRIEVWMDQGWSPKLIALVLALPRRPRADRCPVLRLDGPQPGMIPSCIIIPATSGCAWNSVMRPPSAVAK